jgi:hypothetical protein
MLGQEQAAHEPLDGAVRLVSMADHAVAYAEAGALVLPLHSPVWPESNSADCADCVEGSVPSCSCLRADCRDIGKHPRTLHGHLDATSDVEQVTRWWSMWPNANIGIRPHAGHVVLDIDPRNGGDEQLAAMKARYGHLTPTRAARTGSGGWHLWYRFDGLAVKALAPGIDVKGHGGYVVAPPSVHASGRAYRWRATGDVEHPPAYLVTLLTRPEPVAWTGAREMTPARLAGLVGAVQRAGEGNRNRALHWAACRFAERDADPAPLIEAALSVGLQLDEAQRTVSSALRGAGRTA